jgi:hypothetical protein
MGVTRCNLKTVVKGSGVTTKSDGMCSFPIEKKHLFLRDFSLVGTKIVWFNLTP